MTGSSHEMGAATRQPPARVGTGAVAWALAAALAVPAGCSGPSYTTDGFPINLTPAAPLPESRGPTARGQYSDGTELPNGLSIDTGTSLTLFRRHVERNEGTQMVTRDFDLLDALPSPDGRNSAVVRGAFRDIEVLPMELDPTGPEAVLGGVFLKNFSVVMDFTKPSITFWSRQGASDGLLASSGFAVLHFDLFGGGEVTAVSRPDFLGLTGPVEVPATRVVLRGCGNPTAFDSTAPTPELCCKRGDEVLRATGTDLALVLATGVGPLVLSRSAWNRIVVNATNAGLPPPADPVAGAPLPIPSLAAPITDVQWSAIPRLALVDQESDDSTNAGPCVDLGRARRLEWVEIHHTDPVAPCPQVCDTDPRAAGKAQNAAAYLEIGDNVPVAVLPDATPLLQGLRAEIRPEGPEIDGLVGAGVLAKTTLEIDYKTRPGRALLTCASAASPTACRGVPRCPRLSNPGDMRSCFGRPRQGAPATCMKTAACG